MYVTVTTPFLCLNGKVYRAQLCTQEHRFMVNSQIYGLLTFMVTLAQSQIIKEQDVIHNNIIVTSVGHFCLPCPGGDRTSEVPIHWFSSYLANTKSEYSGFFPDELHSYCGVRGPHSLPFCTAPISSVTPNQNFGHHR